MTNGTRLRIIEQVKQHSRITRGALVCIAKLVIWAGIFLGSPKNLFASDYRVAWMRTASGPGEAMSGREPGWGWLHHSSRGAEAGPSPRVKYQDLYHTAGVLSPGAEVSARGNLIRTPADGILFLQSPDLDIGLGPATEIRIRERGIELLSGELWLESRSQERPAFELLARKMSLQIPKGVALVHLIETTQARPRLQVFEGQVTFQALFDGAPAGERAIVSAGESVGIQFPDSSQGVDNRRFFSAMEPDPEFIREKIDENARTAFVRLRTGPRSPSPVLAPPGTAP